MDVASLRMINEFLPPVASLRMINEFLPPGCFAECHLKHIDHMHKQTTERQIAPTSCHNSSHNKTELHLN